AGVVGRLPPRFGLLVHLGDDAGPARQRPVRRAGPAAGPAPRHCPQAGHAAVPADRRGQGRRDRRGGPARGGVPGDLDEQARGPRQSRGARGRRDGQRGGIRGGTGELRAARHRDRRRPREGSRRPRGHRQPGRDRPAAAAPGLRVPGFGVRGGAAAGAGAAQAHQGARRAEGEAVSARKSKQGRREARAGMSFFPNPWRDLSKRDKKRAMKVMAEPVEVRPQRPPMRGWLGRGRGQSVYVQAPDEWRGTTVQVCGLWPFAIGTGTPMVGVPLGRHIHTGATLCCDPISWFQRAKLISNPSAFVLGKPGLGKSTLVRRMATGLAGYGVMPLVLGDLKPDYVDLIEAMGGQVITLGRGRGYLNVLDPGEATEAAARLRAAGYDRQAAPVLADAHGRRHTMVSALLTILRSAPPTDREETIIDRALKVLDERHEGVPVLGDLLRVIQEGPEEVRAVALDRGSDERYKQITEGLEASLIG